MGGSALGHLADWKQHFSYPGGVDSKPALGQGTGFGFQRARPRGRRVGFRREDDFVSGKIFALFLVIATVALILVGTMWPNQSGSYVSDSNARLMGSASSPQNAVNTL